MKHTQSGFTLIEILIVFAILAILAATVGPYLMGAVQKSRISTAKTSLRTLHGQIDLFNADTGAYPESLKDLVRRPVNEELAKNWVVAYIKDEKSLNDPWGNKYQYQLTPDQEHPYELYSYGPKGKSAPKAERISVWNL
ncbi:MAG: type II secretion system major pseudopilin GspG [Candidatus Babeliales bacterium]